MNLTAIALAAAAASAPVPTPEMRGAVDSPIAFYEVCRDAVDPPADAMKEATEADKMLRSVGIEMCKGMIASVASTVIHGDPYSFEGHRVCIDPQKTTDQVLRELGKFIRENRRELENDQELKTPDAILIALHRMSTCK